jgi:hypothetical protein
MLTPTDLSVVHCTYFVNHRHSGEGRNPARQINREADKATMLTHLRGKFSISWIPAFAGMTWFFLMDNLAPQFFTPHTTATTYN